MSYLKRQGVGAFVSVSTFGSQERVVRSLARKAKSDIVLHQKRSGMRRCLWLEVLEGEPAVHSHVVAAFPSVKDAAKVVASLNAAPSYLRHGPNTLLAEPVTDWTGLTGYLAGEATPQAWFAARRSFPRVSGSHRLGEGGGDRVRCSRDLEAALLRSGRVEPRKRTYAARSLPADATAEAGACVPPISAPQATAAAPISTPVISAPVQLGMCFDVQPVPLRLVEQVEAKRIKLGMTETALARAFGMKQPHFNNVKHGRDKFGPWARRRALEFLRLAA